MQISRIVRAGLLAGILDISATGVLEVLVFKNTTLARLFRGIASGLLGPRASEGGAATVALGVAIHFAIALIWASIFAVSLARLPADVRSRIAGMPLLVGPAYGAFVWLVMAFGVLRFTHLGSPDLDASFWAQFPIHMVCVGTPIAMTFKEAS